MNATKRIRTMLGLTISEFAAVVGVSQGTVSRWENEQTYGHYPDIRQVGLMRDFAIKRGLAWDDSILFPTSAEQVAQSTA